MATKTISVNMEAYGRLTSARRAEESFSDIIIRLVPPRIDVDRWFAVIDGSPLADDTVRAVEEAVARRSRRPRSGA